MGLTVEGTIRPTRSDALARRRTREVRTSIDQNKGVPDYAFNWPRISTANFRIISNTVRPHLVRFSDSPLSFPQLHLLQSRAFTSFNFATPPPSIPQPHLLRFRN